jgi:hypothetical protein
MVGQMKKTDRDKDWPIVFSLGRQMLERSDWLHAQYDTPDDLDPWPPELGGGRYNS